jgi:anti-sigma factor (TIGR02949 family)
MTQVTRYTCEEALRRVNDYLDRALTPDEMRLVAEHLETCAMCAGAFHFERNFIDTLREKLGRLDLPPDLARRIAAQLEAARGEA